MKRLILGSIILLSFSLRANNAFSETQDVLYIVSYNDTSEHVFFCNGVRQNYLNIELYLADISPTADGTFMLDSLILSGDTGDFQFDSTKFVDYSIGLGAAQGGFYVPRHPGMDTLRITGYYGNQSSSGVIILTSLESPDIALYGDINGMEVIDSGYGYEILTQLNYQLASDTLHDRFLPSEYLVSNQPQSHQFNNAVTIKSCGGATLISIDTVGDFSEITLDSIPALPYTIHGDSDLVMPYTFIPHVVGNTHHYLRFHFDDGKILVWSFEYQVVSPNSVSLATDPDALFEVYPNPFDRQTTITWNVRDPASAPLSISIYDALGRLMQNYDASDLLPSSGMLKVPANLLQAGSYTALIRTQEGLKTLKLSVIH